MNREDRERKRERKKERQYHLLNQVIMNSPKNIVIPDSNTNR